MLNNNNTVPVKAIGDLRLSLSDNLSAEQFSNLLTDSVVDIAADSRVVLQGFRELYANSSKKERAALLRAVSSFSGHIDFADNFPADQEKIRTYVAVSELLASISKERSDKIFNYVPEQGMSKWERSLRAKLKKRQRAEFDDRWRKATERILQLKASGQTERQIVQQLSAEKILSRTGKAIAQSGVNRLYKKFISTYQQLQSPESWPVNQALGGIRTTTDDTEEATTKSILESVGTRDEPLIFHEKIELKFSPVYQDYPFLFLKFYDRDELPVEQLKVPSDQIHDGELTIDVQQQTVLYPGFFYLLICPEQEEGLKPDHHSSLGVTAIKVGAHFATVDDVFMRRTFDGNGYEPRLASS